MGEASDRDLARARKCVGFGFAQVHGAECELRAAFDGRSRQVPPEEWGRCDCELGDTADDVANAMGFLRESLAVELEAKADERVKYAARAHELGRPRESDSLARDGVTFREAAALVRGGA